MSRPIGGEWVSIPSKLASINGRFCSRYQTELTIIKAIIQIVTVVAAVGLTVSFIEMDIEVKVAITGLVFLLMLQLQFIISRTRVKGERTPKPGPIASSSQAETQSPDQTGIRGRAIDPSVFSKFQKNLTQSNDSAAEQTDDKANVIVSLSRKSKAKTREKPPETKKESLSEDKVGLPPKKTTGLPSSGRKIADQPVSKLPDNIPVVSIGKLFDDIKETPDITSGKVDPVKLPPKKLDKLILPLDSSSNDTETESAIITPPLTSNEVPTGKDFAGDESETKHEAEITLSIAEGYYQKEQYEKCQTALRQILNAPHRRDTLPPRLMIELMQLKGNCELDQEQYDTASKTLQELFNSYLDKEHPQYLNILEQIIKKFTEAEQQQHAVHFLFTALNEFRQLHEFQKMDEIYTEIEAAYHQKQDWPRLTQTYQNHLAIKKTIKDFKGQLDIFDHLGKLLYDQGDDEGSRKCYEQRLAIENQIEKA
ncbi:hypothetical protein KKI24_26330 [bacterium]|nr:hypothetical protein [bacterium]